MTVTKFHGKASAPNGTVRYLWRCRCSCGTERIVNAAKLRNGHTRSCGCLRAESASRRAKIRNLSGATHGATRGGRWTTEFTIWKGIVTRCTKHYSASWKDYGGRGIHICERWLKFENFLSDVGPRPSLDHSLDRYPNLNGNYEPGNVRWATKKQQARNTRSNVRLTWRGETHCRTEWAERTGIPEHVIRGRLAAGWDIERTMTTPVVRYSRRSG